MPNTAQMNAAIAVLQRTTKRVEDLADGDEAGLDRQQGAAVVAVNDYMDALGLTYVLAENESTLEADQRERIAELEALLETATAPPAEESVATDSSDDSVDESDDAPTDGVVTRTARRLTGRGASSGSDD